MKIALGGMPQNVVAGFSARRSWIFSRRTASGNILTLGLKLPAYHLAALDVHADNWRRRLRPGKSNNAAALRIRRTARYGDLVRTAIVAEQQVSMLADPFPGGDPECHSVPWSLQ